MSNKEKKCYTYCMKLISQLTLLNLHLKIVLSALIKKVVMMNKMKNILICLRIYWAYL
jgi:hypothetical protein